MNHKLSEFSFFLLVLPTCHGLKLLAVNYMFFKLPPQTE